MGRATEFLEYRREAGRGEAPKEWIRDWNEFHTPLSEEEQGRQKARCMDCGVPFCQSDMAVGGMVSGCPLYNLVLERNDLVYTGNWKQAYNRLKRTNSFPESTPRVYPVPYEAICTYSLYGDAVTVEKNERAIIEKTRDSKYALPDPPSTHTGKKMAIIRSGPAGLAAVDQLSKQGHRVTVFERSDRVDGLLMYGIPNMKLEKWVIDHKVDVMKKEGITSVAGVDVGRNCRVNKIRKEFDRIILTCRTPNPRDIDVSGRDSVGIYFVVDFLKATTKGLLDSGLEDGSYISARDRHALVIGDGDTGNDCVGTSIRHDYASVTQLEMTPRPPVERAESNTWPEWSRIFKTDYGQEETISVFGSDPGQYQTTVKEFIKDGEGKACKAMTMNLVPRKDEGIGRTVMVAVEDSEREIPADLVSIVAGLTAVSYIHIRAHET